MAIAAQVEMAVGQESGQFSPEFELLLACCQSGRHGDRLTQALRSPIHWDSVLRLSEHHRILPALHSALYGRVDVPASIQSALRSRFQSNALTGLRFTAELARITRVFHDSGIKVLAHKGPALAQVLYGDPAMRQFGDLDLLVRPRNVVQTKAVLQQLGYEPQLQLSPRQEKAYLHSGYEYVFGLNDDRNLLELQWQILPRFYAVEFDIEPMFKQSIEIKIEGLRVRSLCREDLMLVLCVHAAKHGWAHLGMLRDIATLADFELDWEWVWAGAGRLSIRKILHVSLLLARDLLRCPLPGNMPGLGQIEDAGKLADAIQLRFDAAEEPDTWSLRYFREFAAARERWQDRIRFATRLALTPSLSEWESMRIPDSLFPLYRAVRMGRLLKRAIAMAMV
ncbi:MAG: hypothetical protein DMG98_08850 [Acidobacteria bacterium]|nr:MAG: hypothetical protein DMG98_08850 [Acidobacteriota bacterium]